MVKRLCCLLLCLCFIGALASCQNSDTPQNADATFRYHLDQEPTSLDPQISSNVSTDIAIEALFEGLCRLDSNNDPYPGVALSWEHDDDYTQYTFTLREDAVWSNGDPVTAQDFVFAWQRAIDPSTGSPSATSLYSLKNAQKIAAGELPASELGVTAKSDTCLVVEMDEPDEDFVLKTAQVVFMPCHESFFEETNGRYGLSAEYTLGNGPFAFSNRYAWEQGTYLKLSRSSTYVGENTPLPSLLYLLVGDEEVDVSDPVAAIENGDVDVIEIPGNQIDKAEDSSGQLITFSDDSTWGLCLNLQDDVLKHKDARALFIKTLNRENLLQYLPAHSRQADDILSPAATWNGESYRELAGDGFYVQQDDAILATLSSVLEELDLTSMPSLTVLGPDTDNMKLLLNEMLVVWNGRLGNYFNMKVLPEEELAEKVHNLDYQAAVCSLTPDDQDPLSLLYLFASDSDENPAGLQNKEYDALLQQASATMGDESLQAMKNAEQYLNDSYIFYPLYYTDRYYLTGETVTGLVIHPCGAGINFIGAGKES